MKPPAFDYHAPETLAEAVRVLAETAPHGSVLAGGQSLIPLLNMRLAAPRHVVDITRVPGLDRVGTGTGGVTVGALVRHTDLAADPAAAEAVPLLRQGLRLVAHPVIRNRGTTVGSIAHADPSAEMAAALALLGGEVRVANAAGTRTIAAADLFTGYLETSLERGELITAAFFPAQGPATGSAFAEVARRHGDYAVCGVAALVALDPDLRITGAKAAYLSMGPTPAVLDLTEAVAGLVPAHGPVAPGDSDRYAAAGDLAAARTGPDAAADIHATAEYRTHLARVLTVRALREAGAHAVSRATERAAAGAGRA
ncbi:carbon-monoxide dehydrogenase medium subunit [Murinocardiopsis flavida]|uniref:Carbon-monoxide dehydrogenase medium subunit n=1 Tax=Murinocardiopsis flavida TaxID=645275 RepID=A0A2P8CVY6_9ACTN|nr:FAD binding domain-containing protein [Murinocardiopsis flavida]PSK89142.1 carbon-monoxide dehydrogenase medium subunit [Murinocardiopsis flavida]